MNDNEKVWDGQLHPDLVFFFFQFSNLFDLKILIGQGVDGKIPKPALFTFDFCFYFLFIIFLYLIFIIIILKLIYFIKNKNIMNFYKLFIKKYYYYYYLY